VLAILGVALLTALVTVLFAYRQSRSVSVGLRDFDIRSSPASVTFEVDKPAGRAYRCTLEVQDRQHDPIGTLADIAVPAGKHQVVQTVHIPFRGQAVAVEITDCVRS
jgi:hypothetical protein